MHWLISTQVDAAMGVVSRSVAYRAGFKISDVRVDAVAPVCPVLLVLVWKSKFYGAFRRVDVHAG